MSHGILRFYDLAAPASIIANLGVAGQRHVRNSDRARGLGKQHVQTTH
jgi:hypothetical protein